MLIKHRLTKSMGYVWANEYNHKGVTFCFTVFSIPTRRRKISRNSGNTLKYQLRGTSDNLQIFFPP